MVDAVNAILRQPQAFPGKIDIRRVEAAKANRLKQLQNWEEYDRSMRSLDAASESRKHSNRPRAVKFQQNYVLLDAALRDDIDEVRQLLEQNMDPNVCKDDGLTPLHQACINNSVEMCALLIQHGADVNCRDADLWTPLHAAATSGHTEVCEYLLEHGADLLATNVDGSIPYDIAEDEETSWFLHTQFKIRGLSPSDLETARSAPERRMLADIKRSYNNGESVTELDSQGAAPIHVAAACGFCEVTTMLLRMGVDPNSLDADSWTPAHVAVCWGQVSSSCDQL
ncbi:unnamed protein product [Dicrocoelium dendriticum]|nr:unnamed protein product [Dicrocoelium dendriticum]